MNTKYRVAIIGCGMMGNQHLQAWNRRQDGQITAVCDLMPERRDKMATESGAQAFASYQEAIAASGADIVSVCVPVNLHREVAECAFAHGAHTHVEKPIAGSMADARAIQQAARSAGRKVVVSYQYRGWFGYAKLKEMLGSTLPDERLFFRGTDIREVRPKLAMHHKSMNGGPVIDMAGHYFDMGRYLFNAEPVKVFARGHVYGEGKPRLATVHDKAIDAAEILVEYERGHTLSAHVNWGMPEDFPEIARVEVIGPMFYAAVSQKDLAVTRTGGVENHTAPDSVFGPDCRVADLVRSIETGNAPEVCAETGIRALAVCLSALKSIETGEAVLVADTLAQG